MVKRLCGWYSEHHRTFEFTACPTNDIDLIELSDLYINQYMLINLLHTIVFLLIETLSFLSVIHCMFSLTMFVFIHRLL